MSGGLWAVCLVRSGLLLAGGGCRLPLAGRACWRLRVRLEPLEPSARRGLPPDGVVLVSRRLCRVRGASLHTSLPILDFSRSKRTFRERMLGWYVSEMEDEDAEAAISEATWLGGASAGNRSAPPPPVGPLSSAAGLTQELRVRAASPEALAHPVWSIGTGST